MPKLLVISILISLSAMYCVFRFKEPAQNYTSVVSEYRSGTSIYASGLVKGVSEQAELRTEIFGRVETVHVSEGQTVSKDELLLELTNEEYRHRISLAAARLRLAQAEYDRLQAGARDQERDEATNLHAAKLAEVRRSEKTWEAVRNLTQTKSVTNSEVDQHFFKLQALRAELKAAKNRMDLICSKARLEDISIAKAKVDSAQAQLDLAKSQLDKTRLCSPIDGQVLAVNVECGESTSPQSVKAAITVADTSKFFVVAYVEEYDALNVVVGSRARISADCLSQEIEGNVVFVSPTMRRKSLHSNRPDEYKHSQTRKVRIELLKDDNSLIMNLPVDVHFSVDRNGSISRSDLEYAND